MKLGEFKEMVKNLKYSDDMELGFILNIGKRYIDGEDVEIKFSDKFEKFDIISLEVNAKDPDTFLEDVVNY